MGGGGGRADSQRLVGAVRLSDWLFFFDHDCRSSSLPHPAPPSTPPASRLTEGLEEQARSERRRVVGEIHERAERERERSRLRKEKQKQATDARLDRMRETIKRKKQLAEQDAAAAAPSVATADDVAEDAASSQSATVAPASDESSTQAFTPNSIERNLSSSNSSGTSTVQSRVVPVAASVDDDLEAEQQSNGADMRRRQ